MALPWVRLDTQWAHNPKFLGLVEAKKWRAICVYMAGLGYSGAHGLAGFLPALSLPLLHGTKKEAYELTDAGLWLIAQGGWDINGWAEFQRDYEDAEARRERAKRAAMKRWHPEQDEEAG